MVNTFIPYVKSELSSSAEIPLNITDILGVALFDLNGLPRDYFVTAENPTTSWVQVVFQALGLQSLLSASLAVEGFQQITIQLEATTAMVIRRKEDYIAVQFKDKVVLRHQADEEQLMQLIESLDLEQLRQHPHFSVH